MSSPLARLRARAEPAPSYALRHAYAGVHRLDPALTINGVTVLPTLRHKGGDATLATWPAWGYGESLAIAGAGADPSVNPGSPLPGASDDCVKFNNARYYAGTNGLYQIGTGDFVVEWVGTMSADVARRVYTNSAGGSAIRNGFELWQQAQILRGAVTNGATWIPISTASLPNAWYHAILFADRSGSAIWYVNGSVSGVAADISSVPLSLTLAGYANNLGGMVGAGATHSTALFTIWTRDAWLDTHLQASIAAARFAALTGGPTVAQGSALPDVMTRSSPTHVDKWIGANHYIFYVGANFPSLSSRKDSAGRTLVGIAPDIARTNLCLQSQTLNTTWTKVALTSITDNSGVGPDGTAVLDGIIGTAVDTQHGVSQAIALTATTYAISCWVRAGNKSWAYLSDDTVAGATAYFQLTGDGVLGTKGAGALTSGIESWGGGLYRFWITVTGTAAPHTIVAYAAEADLDNDFAGDAATINLHLGCCQVAAGNFPAAYIPTTTGAVTKTVENHRYPGLANIGGIGSEKQGAIRFKVLATPAIAAVTATDPVLISLSDGGSTADQISVYMATGGNTLIGLMLATGGGGGKWVYNPTNVLDGAIHDCLLIWGNGRFQIFVDGGIAANGSIAVTGAGIPDELDRLSIGEYATTLQQSQGILISDLKVFPRPLRSPIIQGSGWRD